MTVVVQTPYNAHIANGVTTLFGFDFQLLDAADLQVSLDGVVQSTGFSIAGIGVQSGGSITFAVAPASNVLVEIQRLIPLARSTDYQLNGDLPSDQVDRDFDRLWQALQDATYFAGLTVGLPAGDSAAPVILPEVFDRANRFFAFDAEGKAIAALGVPDVPVTAFAATLLDDVDAATARATLGAVGAGLVTASGLTMNTARFLGRTTAGVGGVEELTGAQASSLLTVRPTIQPISASVAANALTLTLNPTVLDFRSATLGSGAVNTRTVSSPINLVISSGSTLGTINGQASRIIVLAIDNAGTVELAAVNLAGGVNLDETNLISTTAEGGAGAADSATVVYSATARTNVPYRVVGYVESTQATAGTWATAPSTIQGAGGQALAAMQSLGYGQTYQSVTRTAGVTYYNTTGKPISLTMSVNSTGVASCSVSISINGGTSFNFVNTAAGTGPVSACGTVIIPAGASYVLTEVNIGGRSIFELR